MRKLFKLLTSVCLLAIVFTSCEDGTKNPLLEKVSAPYVYIELESPVIDVTDIENSYFGGNLVAPSGNVAKYEAYVRRISGGVSSEYELVYSTTSFPADFKITASQIASALGLNSSDLNPGDQFDFVAETTGVDGIISNFGTLGPDIAIEPGQRQAYQLTTYISCPFVQADAIGTYVTTNTDFSSFPSGNSFEVIAGGNTGQIIMVNPFGSPDPDNNGYQVAIDVNEFGIATVPDDQDVFDTDAAGYPGFSDTFTNSGAGFVFSCSGAINISWVLNLQRVSDGANFTWGSANFSAQKQ